MRRIMTIGTLILFIGFTSITVYNYFTERKVEYVMTDRYGSQIASFSLPTFNGDPYLVNNQSGKPKLINFWASWCPYCNNEAPHLTTLYEAYQDKVEFISINVTTGDSVPDARQYIDKYGFEFPTLMDEIGVVSSAFRISAIPTNYFIREDGTIHTITHEETVSSAKGILEEILSE